MPNPRKKIILNEILFWKQNKLLPEHLCDFLMTLYSEGDELEEEEQISHKKAVKAKEKRKNLIMLSSVTVLAILLISLLFMNTNFVLLITLIVGIVACILMISAFKAAKRNGVFAPFLQIASALLIFSLSVKISLTYFENNTIILFCLLIANCLMWLISGLKLKLIYFTLSGILGLVILVCYQIFIRF